MHVLRRKSYLIYIISAKSTYIIDSNQYALKFVAYSVILVNHVGDFRNIDFCVIAECLNKVVQFSPKKRQSLVDKYYLN